MSLTAKLLYCHQKLRKLSDKDGNILSEPYKKLPVREENTRYYSLISNPLSFLVLRNRIDKGKYHSVQDWAADVEILLSNATKVAEGDSKKLSGIAQLCQQLYEVVQETTQDDSSQAINSMGDLERTALTSQVKFISACAWKGKQYAPGDSIRIKQSRSLLDIHEKESHVLVARILRLWKFKYTYGIVCIFYEYSSRIRKALKVSPISKCEYDDESQDILDYTSTLFKELNDGDHDLCITSIIRICHIEDLIDKCSVKHNDSINSQSRQNRMQQLDADLYSCKAFYDFEKHRLHPFVFRGSESFTYALQLALNNTRSRKNEFKRHKCCYDESCEKICHSIETLVRHSTEHIAQQNAPELASLPKIASTGRKRTTKARIESLRSYYDAHEYSEYSEEYSYPNSRLPSISTSPLSIPSNIAQFKQIGNSPHQDYPIRFQKSEQFTTKSDYLKRLYGTDKNGDLLWFDTPPLDVLPRSRPLHSIDYILFQQSRSENKDI